jgi:N-acetylglutamate synthase-like GNAT family acetyltransferase
LIALLRYDCNMPEIIESHRDALLISTDPSRLDLDAITDMLSRAYWAKDRTREIIVRAMQNSLVFGVYDGNRQIGLARVVSDYATFAWLCDVFIHEDYRQRGIGKWLMETILAHPDLHGLRRFLLITRDAHGLYSQYGFTPLQNPDRWMEKINA